jgi:hypothetical protein
VDDLAELLRFDPDAATVIRAPEGTGSGHWVGAPKVSHDAASGLFVMSYRVRAPLEQGRGGVTRIATSRDGIAFDDVWQATKADLLATSIEAGHCVRDGDEWRLYLSYELDVARPYWRVDVIRGPEPGKLDTQGRRTVLLPLDYGLHSIKDPWVQREPDGAYRVYVSTDPRDRPRHDGPVIHAGSRCATAIARSTDGLSFPTVEYVFEASLDDSWHGRRARLNCLVPIGDGWVGTFDGGRTYFDNFEEPCGLVTSPDGKQIDVLDTDGPWVSTRHGTARYVWGVRAGQRLLWYAECALPDGSHDLRVAEVALPDGW